MHWYWQDVDLDGNIIIFVSFQQLLPLTDVKISFMLNILCINLWISIKYV